MQCVLVRAAPAPARRSPGRGALLQRAPARPTVWRIPPVTPAKAIACNSGSASEFVPRSNSNYIAVSWGTSAVVGPKPLVLKRKEQVCARAVDHVREE